MKKQLVLSYQHIVNKEDDPMRCWKKAMRRLQSISVQEMSVVQLNRYNQSLSIFLLFSFFYLQEIPNDHTKIEYVVSLFTFLSSFNSHI
jgi:hypothetical protein